VILLIYYPAFFLDEKDENRDRHLLLLTHFNTISLFSPLPESESRIPDKIGIATYFSVDGRRRTIIALPSKC
jgi:hypothetical protein